MRSFIISTITLISVIGLCAFSSHKTAVITGKLLDSLSILEQQATVQAYEEYRKLWEKHSFFFDTTLPRHKYELIIEGMAIIPAAIEENDSSAFRHGINITRDVICSIAESDKLTLKNIL